MKVVNRVILCGLFSVLASVGGAFYAAAQVVVPASDLAIYYGGRWDRHRAAVAETGRGAAYVRTGFNGSEVGVALTNESVWWSYSIDGAPLKRFRPAGKMTVLASGLRPGAHELFLIRETEGNGANSEFSGVVLADGGTLSKTAVSNRRLEFIGDSISAGAWDRGMGDYVDQQDGSMAFGPQLARLLKAEYMVTATSGEGVMLNYSERRDSTVKSVHAPSDYVRMFRDAAKPAWNFKQFQPQAVIIAFGTNDFTDPEQAPTQEEFQRAYTRLIRLVWANNPQAAIICTEPVPAWLGEPVRVSIEKAVATVTRGDDHKVYFLALNDVKPLLAPADYADGSTHPLVAGQTKLALNLQHRVAALLGWDREKVYVPQAFLDKIV